MPGCARSKHGCGGLKAVTVSIRDIGLASENCTRPARDCVDYAIVKQGGQLRSFR